MKKRLFGLLAAIAVLAFAIAPLVARPADPAPALPTIVQDAPQEAPSIDPTTMEAILVIAGGGIVTGIVAGIKALTKVSGTPALIVTGIVNVGVVAAYFLILHPPFDLPRFILYSVAIFGEATGWFHFYHKRA
jgi:hypothetical protein